jgi:hypothetical protein
VNKIRQAEDALAAKAVLLQDEERRISTKHLELRKVEGDLNSKEHTIRVAEQSSLTKIREAEAALAAKERALEAKFADAEQALHTRGHCQFLSVYNLILTDWQTEAA